MVFILCIIEAMKVDKSKLKMTGMVAAIIAVVGITVIIANSQVGLTGGVSADVKDLATGNVTVMSKEDYDSVLVKLNEYSQEAGNRVAQDNLIAEVVNILKNVQK